MNRDFVEMLSALSEAGVEYLLVGAYALAAYGIPRATGDIDIVRTALATFGAPDLALLAEQS